MHRRVRVLSHRGRRREHHRCSRRHFLRNTKRVSIGEKSTGKISFLVQIDFSALDSNSREKKSESTRRVILVVALRERLLLAFVGLRQTRVRF